MGIKSRVSVLGHVHGVARSARERRKAARGRSGKPGRESRRREESGSTTKSLNRFAPPSATEHGPSIATATAAAAIAVPSSVHACPTLSLSFSLPFFLLSPFSSFLLLADSLRLAISVFLSFSLSLSLSLPRLLRSLPLSLSPRDSLCHFGPRRFHGQSVSDSCQWPTRCVRVSRDGLTRPTPAARG